MQARALQMVDATINRFFFEELKKKQSKSSSISFISFYHCKCLNMHYNDQHSERSNNALHDHVFSCFGIVWPILLRPLLFLSSLNIFLEFSVWAGSSLHNLFPIDTLPMFEAWGPEPGIVFAPLVCWIMYYRPPACLSCLPYWDDLLALQLLVGSPHEVSIF